MSKTLIAYYTLSGMTKKVTEKLADMTGGDLKEIQLEKPITALQAYAKGFFMRNSKNPPKLKEDIDISGYDTIYIGTPIWWYTTTPAVRSFLKNKDFSGKKLIPFCTDGGNCGNYFQVMKELPKNAEIGEGKEFQFVGRLSDSDIENMVKDWIK